MKDTYNEAIAQVFKDEGGYSNVPGDHGGPTNYGITIWDARKYWKPNATADDVKNMPKSVAADIYEKHYASALNYNNLPAGVDYSVLDYGINSGIGRALNVYKTNKTIDAIYDEREAFLKQISTHPGQAKFLKGWLNRTKRGRALAKHLEQEYGKTTIPVTHVGTGSVIAAGGLASYFNPHLVIPIIIASAVVAVAVYFLIKHLKGNK